VRKERLICEKYELDNQIKMGDLAPVSESNAWVSSMIVRARDILTRIAPELCDRLAVETNPQRIRELIDAEVVRALSQLSQYKGAQ